MYKKILVPLDGSKTAEVVLAHAQALAFSEGAEIVLLRVAMNVALEFAMTDPAIIENVIQDLQAQSQKYLDDIQAQLKAANIRSSAMVREGAVADVILQTAEELGVDVIAMSTHGRTGPARWLLGSVADRVVRNSNVPVMLVRAK